MFKNTNRACSFFPIVSLLIVGGMGLCSNLSAETTKTLLEEEIEKQQVSIGFEIDPTG